MTTRDLAKVGEVIANKGADQQNERMIPAVFIAMVGIHGQILVIEPQSQTIITMNPGFGDMEPPRMAIFIFQQIIPAMLN